MSVLTQRSAPHASSFLPRGGAVLGRNALDALGPVWWARGDCGADVWGAHPGPSFGSRFLFSSPLTKEFKKKKRNFHRVGFSRCFSHV